MLREDLSNWVCSVAPKLQGVRSPRHPFGNLFFWAFPADLSFKKPSAANQNRLGGKKNHLGNFYFEGLTCQKLCQTVLALMNLLIKQGFRSCLFSVEPLPFSLGQQTFAYIYGTMMATELWSSLVVLPSYIWGPRDCQDHPVGTSCWELGEQRRR